MTDRAGSIWTFHAEGRWIVIPTNIGWKADGSNPMGAGMAKQVAELYPELPGWYGLRCKKYGADTAVCPYIDGRLLLFPTKPLDEEKPWLSWKNDADINLVVRSIKELPLVIDHLVKEKKQFIGEVGMPMVGCGAGGLCEADVERLLRAYLDNRFVLFKRS